MAYYGNLSQPPGKLGATWGTGAPRSIFTPDIGIDEILQAGDILQPYIIEEQWLTNAFVQSGIMALDPRMNDTTGVRILLPFFKELEAQEEQIRSDDTWGISGAGYLTPQKTSADRQIATITTRGNAFASDTLVTVQTGTDPLAVVRSQMASEMNKFLGDKLLSYLEGLLDPTAGVLKDNIYVATGLGEPYMSANVITNAKYKLGNRAQTVGAMVIHPNIAGDLELLGMQTMAAAPGGAVNLASSGIGVSNTQVRTFAGMNIVIDDRVPVQTEQSDGTPLTPDEYVYTSYMFAPGVIRTGAQFPLEPIFRDDNKLSFQEC